VILSTFRLDRPIAEHVIARIVERLNRTMFNQDSRLPTTNSTAVVFANTVCFCARNASVRGKLFGSSDSMSVDGRLLMMSCRRLSAVRSVAPYARKYS
jgi:hypothetical protein